MIIVEVYMFGMMGLLNPYDLMIKVYPGGCPFLGFVFMHLVYAS